MQKSTSYKIFTFTFLIFIFAFLSALIFFPKEEFSEQENRVLESFPEFSIESLLEAQWTKDFETYLNDHAPFRNFFVSARTEIVQGIGYKEVNGVYLGLDGYQLQKIEVGEEDMQISLDSVSSFIQNNEDKNIVASVVPSASFVLEDKLPQNAYLPFDEEKFQSNAQALLGDKYIDLTPVLKDSDDEYIYYKTDHHWTTNGAYIAFEEISEKLGLEIFDDYEVLEISDEFLGTTYSKTSMWGSDFDTVLRYDLNSYEYDYAVTIPEINETYNSIYFEEFLSEKDKYLYFTGHNRALIEIQTKNNTGKEITIIKDSIANAFIPFLIPYYDKINVVDLRFYNEDINELIKNSDDVLILYYTEGFSQHTSISKLAR